MMRFRSVTCALIAGSVAVLSLISCGGYSSPTMTRAGVGAPMIAQLVPSSMRAGSGAFNMTINGSGFGADALVYWNGSPLNTAYVSGNQLVAMVPTADDANAGMIPVYVRTGGQNSNTVDFSVN